MSRNELKDKVVVITGASGLLGSEFARAAAAEGAVVAAADIRQGESAPGIHPFTVDINSEASVDTLITDVKTKFGRIDAVVNAAYPKNARYGAKLENVRYADFCENVNLHLGGYFLVCQKMGIFFKAQGHGNIVNLASVYAAKTPRFDIYEGTDMTMPVEYAAIKAGIVQLTRYFAAYFKNTGIRANCISPGGILNGQSEAFLKKYNAYGKTKGMLDKSDVNGTLIFLLSDASNYLNGQNIVIDDGWSS